MKKSLTKYDCDEHLVISIVAQCRDIMHEYPTVTNMTACYNLTIGVLRLFMVCGSKKDVRKLIDKFHKGLLAELDKCMKEKDT